MSFEFRVSTESLGVGIGGLGFTARPPVQVLPLLGQGLGFRGWVLEFQVWGLGIEV